MTIIFIISYHIFQEKAGVKMVMVQDGPMASAPEKPLRIMGDPMKVQRARDMVLDLLASKDMVNVCTNN